MFNDLVESCAVKEATNKSWTVIASGASQIVLLSLLVLLPLIYTQALPKTLLNSFLLAPTPPARVVRDEQPKRVQQPHRLLTKHMIAPTFIPLTVANVVDDLSAAPDVPDARQNPIFENIAGDNPIPIVKSPEPIALETNPRPTPRILRGGNIQQAMLVSQTKPIYPVICIQAHIQGNVVLHAIIDKEGKVVELQAIGGPPLLIPAAMDAVRQWRYRPTMLNGDPVEVDTTITVSFRIAG